MGYVLADGSKYLKRAGEVEIAAGEAGMLSNIEAFLQKAPNILLTESQVATAGASVHNVSKIAIFEAGAAELAVKYGDKILNDAKKALKINDYKILKNDHNKLILDLEKNCQNIKKIIESKPHRTNFIYDVDHSFNPTNASIKEALTASAVEDQGFVNLFKRSIKEGVDFIDEFGNEWDIKSPISRTE